MDKEKFIEIWDLHSSEEYANFSMIKNPPCESTDLSAFMILHKFAINKEADIINSAEHDEIYLMEIDNLNIEKITENDIINLIRCGVRLDKEMECFCMFV